ncbi:hypothetical protein ATZ36_07725 [Candidatus Endomicrobiellum trichonymphae]|uniref:Uncharacterized protein n=1 Tax=Endomicrobium trichonymphae TaxID=1408204 RepID=A0A1E5IHU4_ENDTX|nr:hypothetical protein ATZ36_07725 [Candidatus Endomicrobium trichonymphae]
MPDNNKFYYLGITNSVDNCLVDKDEKENDALLGFIISEKAEIYGGMVKSKAGIGFGYSFFPIYVYTFLII